MKKHLILIPFLGIFISACAPQYVRENPALKNSVEQMVRNGPLGEFFTEEDFSDLESGLTTVHQNPIVPDEWTSKNGHLISIIEKDFGERKNGFVCMKARILVDQKEALPESPLCRQGSWWVVVPESELEYTTTTTKIENSIKIPKNEVLDISELSFVPDKPVIFVQAPKPTKKMAKKQTLKVKKIEKLYQIEQ